MKDLKNKPEITITDVRVLPGDSAFLIDDGKTAILYDSGFAFTGCSIAENIKKILKERTLDYIFLTHSHYDHVLGVPSILAAYPEAKVVAGVYAAKVFAKASVRATMESLDRKAALRQNVSAGNHSAEGLRVDIVVQDEDVISCGSMEITVIALPGHTKCSVGYYLKDHKLLLGTETLGVYFGGNTYLPSFLVGYRLALDSFQRARSLDVEQMLLPHYGVVEKKEIETYLTCSEAVTVDTAQTILSLLRQGCTQQEILAYLQEKDYRDNVAPIYPLDAFLLNTGIMIERVRAELMKQSEK